MFLQEGGVPHGFWSHVFVGGIPGVFLLTGGGTPWPLVPCPFWEVPPARIGDRGSPKLNTLRAVHLLRSRRRTVLLSVLPSACSVSNNFRICLCARLFKLQLLNCYLARNFISSMQIHLFFFFF